MLVEPHSEIVVLRLYPLSLSCSASVLIHCTAEVHEEVAQNSWFAFLYSTLFGIFKPSLSQLFFVVLGLRLTGDVHLPFHNHYPFLVHILALLFLLFAYSEITRILLARPALLVL